MPKPDIHSDAVKDALRLLKVAEECGITPSTVPELLNSDLPDEKKQYILDMVEKIAQIEL